jgi:hypothetical protein
MKPFSHLLDLLATVPDPRRAQGKMYSLRHILLFSIFGLLSGANSYRAIHSFIDVHLVALRDAFGLHWRRAPAYTSLRAILRRLDAQALEHVFRLHAALLAEHIGCEGVRVVAFDGKTLRGSFDQFEDRAAVHLVSALDCASALVLGHLEVGDKRSPRFRPCWPRWGWLTVWSPPMPCTVKKNFRGSA